jgi:hypothetical protein
VRKTTILALAGVLALLACASVWSTARKPVVWTPDALFYEARMLEIRGVDHDKAMAQTFRGPLSAELRARDPHKTGDPAWVAYNEQFYQRRVALPLVGAGLYPLTGDRSLLYLSLAGYVAAVLALFGFLLLRFRVWLAAGVAAAAALLPPLVNHSSYPLTDSWGLALEIVAFGAAFLTLKRGLRWLPLWILTLGILGFTRDSAFVPVLAAGWLALRERKRIPVALFLGGLAAVLPASLLFASPVREVMALAVNHSEPSSDTSWWFIARHYPGSLIDLLRANVGFLRRGEWYTALFFFGGVASLFAFWRRRPTVSIRLLVAGVILGLAYVLSVPVFSAFRLELVFVPMAAYGLALAAEYALARLAERPAFADRFAVRVPARVRRP